MFSNGGQFRGSALFIGGLMKPEMRDALFIKDKRKCKKYKGIWEEGTTNKVVSGSVQTLETSYSFPQIIQDMQMLPKYLWFYQSLYNTRH